MNRAYGAAGYLDFGVLLSRSFENLWLIWRQVLAYLAAAAVLGIGFPLTGEQVGGIVGLALYFGGQYWLFHAVLKARGMVVTPRIHFLGFVGLAALIIVPIMLGLALLVLPGLFLVARYIAAPAFIVARGEGVLAAIGSSSQSVRGNTAKVAGAVVVLFLIVSVLSTITSAIGGGLSGFASFRGAGPVDMIETQLLPLLLLGLSVASYELLGPEDTSIEDVFG